MSKKTKKTVTRVKTTAHVIGAWKGKTKSKKCHYMAVNIRGHGIRRFVGKDVPARAGAVLQCTVTTRKMGELTVKDVSFVE